jgi:hypothetical protein
MKKIVLFIISMIFFLSPGLSGQDVQKAQAQSAEIDLNAAEQVIINGTILSAQQILEMEQAYGVKPLPGNYWYDASSGLYGVVGYPSYGFMLAGYDTAGQLLARCRRKCWNGRKSHAPGEPLPGSSEK